MPGQFVVMASVEHVLAPSGTAGAYGSRVGFKLRGWSAPRERKLTMAEQNTVILIDDDPLFARDVQVMVEPNATFCWLDGSARALETIRRENPRVILLDLHMPRGLSQLDEEEGLEVLRRLSSSERQKVIVVTRALAPRVEMHLWLLGVASIYMKSEPMTKLKSIAAEMHRPR